MDAFAEDWNESQFWVWLILGDKRTSVEMSGRHNRGDTEGLKPLLQ
jgi:hypothetical protein